MTTDLSSLAADQLERLYQAGGFLIIQDLPHGAEFGIDGSLWNIAAFSGIKLVPAGFHLATCSANARIDPESISNGIGIRHALLHFVKPKEIVVRRWDVEREELVADTAVEQPAKRRRLANSASESTESIASPDFLRSIDSQLAPYPFDKLAEWTSLTSLVDEQTIARVVGFDQNADAMLDSLTPSKTEAGELHTTLAPKLQWGKPRADEGTLDPVSFDKEVLNFCDFDLKRSWPPGSTGSELTKYSQDKSWLLSNVIQSQLGRDHNQYLAEVQLAFVLFTLVQNHSSLDVYRRLLALVCRAQSHLNQGGHQLITNLIENVLLPQWRSLRQEFFESDCPELENFYIKELETLRKNIRSDNVRDDRLFAAWDCMIKLTSEEFGWAIASLSADPSSAKKRTIHYDLLRERQGDDDDLLAEEDEDRPVVVSLDHF